MPDLSAHEPRRISRQKDDDITLSKPRISRTESPATSEKPVDIGAPLGSFDRPGIREKVRKWQTQGGGVVAADDVGPGDEDKHEGVGHFASKSTAIESKPVTPRSTTCANPDERRTRIPRSTRHVALDEDVRSASAPRKRVISDEHWKNNRSSPSGSTSSPGITSPRVKLHDDGIRVRAIRDSGQSRARESVELKGPSVDDSDRIRLYSTPRRNQSDHVEPDQKQDGKGKSSENGKAARNDEERRIPISTTPYAAPRIRRVKDQSGDESSNASKPDSTESGGKPTLITSTSMRTTGKSTRDGSSKERRRRSRKSQETGIEGESVDSSADAKPPIPIFGSRIEAWLSTAPDPFVERKLPRTETPLVDVPASMGKDDETLPDVSPDDSVSRIDFAAVNRGSVCQGTSKRLHHRSFETRHDLNMYEDHISKAPAYRSRPPAPSQDYVSVDIVTNAPSLSPPSLKRSGAKRNLHSPTRRRKVSLPKDDSPTEDEEALPVTSSHVEGHSFEIPEMDLKKYAIPVFRKPFPSTGKRLSTIASVDTFNTKQQPAAPESLADTSQGTVRPLQQSSWPSEAGGAVNFDGLYGPRRQHRSVKRKLTSHTDLISVLSMPMGDDKRSITSARSIRTSRSRLATATINDVMNELAIDETKYMRELRTLVDGVIPVLLTCVLSKSDSAMAAGLFRASAKNDPSVTKPIIDMGIALERLKSVHKRIPTQNPAAFLLWAQGAQRMYSDYLKAWRLGFQDVVVNLAPADGNEGSNKDPFWDEGLPRNEDGDVINGDGERVDVAFLLKRPLGICYIQPSEQAQKLAGTYENLINDARRRSNEERARLEDEAAASTDPTRARDPRTLAPLAGVNIESTRSVRARDYFDMKLRHSSGQQLDCRVELLLRDNQPEHGAGGDLLICEVDSTGKWLLFPPQQLGMVSARVGRVKGEIVAMIRGFDSAGNEWRELMSMIPENEQTSSEWVQMLGLQPVPPGLPSLSSFTNPRKAQDSESSHDALVFDASTPLRSRTPSPREVEVPIGEQAVETSKRWSQGTSAQESSVERHPSNLWSQARNRLQRKSRSTPQSPVSAMVDCTQAGSSAETQSVRQRHGLGTAKNLPPGLLNEAMRQAGSPGPKSPRSYQPRSAPSSPLVGVSAAEELPRWPNTRPSDRSTFDNEEPSWTPTASVVSRSSRDYKVWFPTPDTKSEESSEDQLPDANRSSRPQRPSIHRRTSSVPSDELPSIPKMRKTSQPSTSYEAPVEDVQIIPRIAVPTSAPSKLQKERSVDDKNIPKSPSRNPQPAPRSHGTTAWVQPKGPRSPQTSPPSLARAQHRRSSSPLKHEYEPSTASESSSESGHSSEDDHFSGSSESSDVEGLRNEDIPTPLLPVNALPTPATPAKPFSAPSLASWSISPSQSASQAPYSGVPLQSGKPGKSIASVFAWSEQGHWQCLHPDECSIVVTPGLISAYEVSAAHSRPFSSATTDPTSPTIKSKERPLVAVELTPLVPLRRGTALDISIRSPPTFDSKVRQGNNIMFRSRNPDECEALYKMINQARINNPTYIALQNARGPYGGGTWAAAMDRRSAMRGNGGGSWWHFGSSRSSYRAGSTKASHSVAAVSESSVGTMASAFSALLRFYTGSKLFNVGKSTITSRAGSRSTTTGTHSSSSGGGSGSGASTPIILDPANGTPLGIANMKIRLYERETASKWRDMGSARLTILHPPRNAGPSSPALPQSPNLGTSKQVTGQEKRIVVTGKTKGETLLDVTLGESCFERVARTGIAVSVWEEARGEDGRIGMVGKTGGVVAARARVFMIQMKNEAETAYTFSLVGKLRY